MDSPEWERAMEPGAFIKNPCLFSAEGRIVEMGHRPPLRYSRVLTLFHIWPFACLDLRTTITRIPQRIACRIFVIEPVRSGCKLRNELRVAQLISIYASLFCCVFGTFASLSMEIPNHYPFLGSDIVVSICAWYTISD